MTVALDAATRDALGRALGYEQSPNDTWTGSCPACGASGAQVWSGGLTCADDGCLKLNMKEASARYGSGADAQTPAFMLLADLLARPELLEPPECVMPRLAYRARATLLAGPDKSGKSTFLAHAVTALTLGQHWLGEPTTAAHVVWIGLEEALGDAVRRFNELGADPGSVQLVTLSPPDLLERTRQLLKTWPADLVVVDSLSEYARVTLRRSPEDGDNAAWGAVVRPWVALAREANVAVVILHHVRRSDGQARGASEILAAVDCTLELHLPKKKEDPSVRRVEGRARWPLEPYRVALRDGHYGLADGDGLSLDTVVLLHIEQEPGISKARIRKLVQGRHADVDAAIKGLLERGAIINRGTDRRMALRPAPEQLELGSGVLQ